MELPAELKEFGFDERVKAALAAAQKSGRITLSEIQQCIPETTRNNPPALRLAMLEIVRSLGALKIKLASVSPPREEPRVLPPEKSKKTQVTKKQSLLEELQEKWRNIRDTKRPLAFERWMEFYDESIGYQDLRDAIWTHAESHAVRPVHFCLLFFRASGKEEVELLERIKQLEASPKDWLEAALIVSPSPLATLIISKVPMEQWVRWSKELPTFEERRDIKSLYTVVVRRKTGRQNPFSNCDTP